MRKKRIAARRKTIGETGRYFSRREWVVVEEKGFILRGVAFVDNE
jgi:hypothetical protein